MNKTWPSLHSKRIVQVTDSLAEFLTSEKAVKHLNENKLTVTVHIPNNDGSLLSIPHPPLWDHNRDLPLMPGDYFPLLYVCQKHDLSFNKRGSSTWGTDSRALVLVLLYHDYKSVLPF